MTAQPPDACTLGPSRLDERLSDWRLLLSSVVAVDKPDARTVTLRFADTAAGVDIAALCAQEVQCCSFFTFDIRIAAGETALTISVPASDAGALPLLVGLLPERLTAPPT